ncbi:Dabb family protein [Clostridium felsineum]|uniref:Dabb family protein n=1 Tax=Clostridium felsineum TaxID=36839 RepID=UPI00098BF026|nr:Dabb family protein [Clostridium felsineum]MCR3760530.1 Dabb family protein [Clostridium felsineum]URZ17932.1 hypothetical protein CLFE_039870 [Clostridium felsineum DSM 794]
MFTHIVFFKLNDRKNVNEVKKIFQSIEGNIDFARKVKVGVDVVHSQRAYDIALIIKFDSLKDMETYQVHPYHVDVVMKKTKEFIQSSASVDFED